MELFDHACAGNRNRQMDQRRGQSPVDLLGPLGSLPAGRVEKERPIDGVLARNGAEAKQVRKDREWRRRLVQLIPLADLAVPVSVGGVRELERDEHVIFRREPPGTIRDNFINQLSTDERRQKLVEDDPLIVPSRLTSRREKDLWFRDTAPAYVVDKDVVGLQQREMHLRHQHVRVVPRVADDRDAFAVSRDVCILNAQQKLRRVITSVEKRMSNRAVAIQTFEIQLRRTRIAQGAWIDVALQRRSIGRDVMGHELPKDRPPGGSVSKRTGSISRVTAITQSTGSTEGGKKRLVRVEPGQFREHPRVSRRTGCGTRREMNARWRKTVHSRDPSA